MPHGLVLAGLTTRHLSPRLSPRFPVPGKNHVMGHRDWGTMVAWGPASDLGDCPRRAGAGACTRLIRALTLREGRPKPQRLLTKGAAMASLLPCHVRDRCGAFLNALAGIPVKSRSLAWVVPSLARDLSITLGNAAPHRIASVGDAHDDPRHDRSQKLGADV